MKALPDYSVTWPRAASAAPEAWCTKTNSRQTFQRRFASAGVSLGGSLRYRTQVCKGSKTVNNRKLSQSSCQAQNSTRLTLTLTLNNARSRYFPGQISGSVLHQAPEHNVGSEDTGRTVLLVVIHDLGRAVRTEGISRQSFVSVSRPPVHHGHESAGIPRLPERVSVVKMFVGRLVMWEIPAENSLINQQS